MERRKCEYCGHILTVDIEKYGRNMDDAIDRMIQDLENSEGCRQCMFQLLLIKNMNNHLKA